MKTKCLRCKGHGLLGDHNLVVLAGRSATQIDPVPCDECNGTGVKDFPGEKKPKK
jgi:DnaJ-class molecular chaperone